MKFGVFVEKSPVWMHVYCSLFFFFFLRFSETEDKDMVGLGECNENDPRLLSAPCWWSLKPDLSYVVLREYD